MQKIGKEVLFLPTSNTILRRGEGAFLRLNTGAIMFAYTEYYGIRDGVFIVVFILKKKEII